MAATGTAQPATDEHVFLMGRPPLGEYLGTLTSLASDPQDMRILADEWRAANDHIRELEEREAGLADRPTIQQLPGELEPQAQDVVNNPIFRQAFSIVPSNIGIVQLDRLVVYQKHINLEFVRALQGQLGDNPNVERIFQFCLLGQPRPEVRRLRVANNVYVFVSPSSTLLSGRARRDLASTTGVLSPIKPSATS